MKRPKTCLSCKHCIIDFGSPAYSDLTPGSPGLWECAKGHWSHDNLRSGNNEQIERDLLCATKCPHYESAP